MKSLVLDHQNIPFDKLLLKIDSDAGYLSLNNCGLTSIANFPHMPNLTKVRNVKVTTVGFNGQQTHRFISIK